MAKHTVVGELPHAAEIVQALRSMMEAWTKAETIARAKAPNATPEEINRMTRKMMDESLRIIADRKPT